MALILAVFLILLSDTTLCNVGNPMALIKDFISEFPTNHLTVVGDQTLNADFIWSDIINDGDQRRTITFATSIDQVRKVRKELRTVSK